MTDRSSPPLLLSFHSQWPTSTRNSTFHVPCSSNNAAHRPLRSPSTVLGGEHHQGGESEDLDKAYEHPPASRIANDAGKAHAYANGKVNGAGPGAGEKEGPDTTTAVSFGGDEMSLDGDVDGRRES